MRSKGGKLYIPKDSSNKQKQPVAQQVGKSQSSGNYIASKEEEKKEAARESKQDGNKKEAAEWDKFKIES